MRILKRIKVITYFLNIYLEDNIFSPSSNMSKVEEEDIYLSDGSLTNEKEIKSSFSDLIQKKLVNCENPFFDIYSQVHKH